MSYLLNRFTPFVPTLLLLAALVLGAGSAWSQVVTCNNESLSDGLGAVLEVTGPCQVAAGTYNFGNVNIFNGGSLIFSDSVIDFWASSILVEKNSSLNAGTPSSPIGSHGGRLTIHLYGSDQGTSGSGIVCKTSAHCGIDDTVWNSNEKVNLPGGVSDYFYPYEPLRYDTGDPNGYFGYKVLAVSYGATLALYGSHGSTFGNDAISDSGRSWVRLNATVTPGQQTLLLDRAVDWQPGDQIVVTTTDYLPGHSEQLTIDTISSSNGGTTLTVKESLAYAHNGQTVDLSQLPPGIGPDANPIAGPSSRYAETRAAVALLTRSIRIVSAGDKLGDDFPADSTGYYFGGHMIIRQGFGSVGIQGVEFYQMGQGGRMGHYPLHFHMARRVPDGTTIADCSIHDSMTRWVTLHATQGRNAQP